MNLTKTIFSMMCLVAMPSLATNLTEDSVRVRPREKLREVTRKVDSLRTQFRQSADRGETLQWGDSILTARYNKKTFDTTYIARPDTRWTVKLRENVSSSALYADTRDEGLDYNTELKSEVRSTVSLAVAYRGVGLALSMNPSKLAGRSQDYEFNINSYSNRFGFDVVYLSSKTYQGYTEQGGVRMDIPKGLIAQHALNLNVYYAFNHRKFSFPAAFSQSYIQKRSAGSWLVGASFEGSKTEVNTDDDHPFLYPITIRLNELAVGGGYGYNLALGKHWLFHLSAIPTITVYSHDYTKTQTVGDDGETRTVRNNMKYHFPSPIITVRGAALYSWRNKFAGATMVYNYSVVGSDDLLQVRRFKWRVRLFFGFRI